MSRFAHTKADFPFQPTAIANMAQIPTVATFDSLPDDVLSEIAVETIYLRGELPTYGDLATLHSLSLTCRTIYHAISFTNRPGLYAAIFRAFFDMKAIQRRLGSDATYSRLLAHALKERIGALKRFATLFKPRSENTSEETSPSNVPNITLDNLRLQDLTTAWFMVMEHDHRNLLHLVSVNLSDGIFQLLTGASTEWNPQRHIPKEIDGRFSLCLTLCRATSECIEHAGRRDVCRASDFQRLLYRFLCLS